MIRLYSIPVSRTAISGGALAALILASAGCGGPSFERDPRPTVDLAGHWVYVASASDDANAIILAALPKPRRPAWGDRDPSAGGMMADGSAGPPGGGGNGGQRRGGRGRDTSNTTASQYDPSLGPAVLPAWGRGSAGDYVRAFALPAPRLDLAMQPALVTVTQGDRRRSFQPGDDEPFSVNDRFGSRIVRAGWNGTTFLVKSTGGTRLSILESFRRVSHDQLATEVDFSAQGVKTVKIHSVYRRATASEIAAPPPEGPPVPGPH